MSLKHTVIFGLGTLGFFIGTKLRKCGVKVIGIDPEKSRRDLDTREKSTAKKNYQKNREKSAQRVPYLSDSMEEMVVTNSAFFYQIVPLQKQIYSCRNSPNFLNHSHTMVRNMHFIFL